MIKENFLLILELAELRHAELVIESQAEYDGEANLRYRNQLKLVWKINQHKDYASLSQVVMPHFNWVKNRYEIIVSTFRGSVNYDDCPIRHCVAFRDYDDWLFQWKGDEAMRSGMDERIPRVLNMSEPDAEEAVVEIIQEAREITIPDFRDKKLAGHGDVIKKRNDLMKSEMQQLAKAMFAMTLYTEKPTVIVENCKFAVNMDAGNDRMFVSFYLKDTEGDEKTTWKDLINSEYIKSLLHTKKPFKARDVMATAKDYILGKDIHPRLPLTVRGKRKQDKATIGTYAVDRAAWVIVENSLPVALIKLLPAANVLVQGELDILKEEAEDAIAFVEAFGEEME